MPIVNFHLAQGSASPEQQIELLGEASRLYSQVLASPIDRVRAMISLYPRECFAVAGEVGRQAPYFEFRVLDGRPLEERRRLMAGFTELLVRILDVQPQLVRGLCIRVQPEDWSIGGIPADLLRAAEIAARDQAGEAAS
ncbi:MULTISPECIES: 4-oxalocrotonate tautomerase [Pseudomonadaceae]|uniref:4-oxalocrotonate tautomerase n=1 Tax=Pseudomonadaceae TaxID=135621 RepID=UPI001F48C6BE|nr:MULTISPECIES: 4-oxalocrotonate tautomerase [Pseudomonadaceae]UIP85908.1 4-oxalocrotonate tautomerase [Pseudomonas phenolilytica]